MEFRERLYQLRKGRGISQEELAHTVGVSRQAVQKWEAGAATPDLNNLSALADYFAVSLDYLVRGIEPEKPAAPSPQQAVIQNYYRGWRYEYRSRRTLFGLPLVHINLCDRSLCRAKGVIAIGNVATGLIAIGGFSAGRRHPLRRSSARRPRRRPEHKERTMPMRRQMQNKGELAVMVVCVVVGFLLAAQLRSVKLAGAADATNASRLETLQNLYNEVVDQKDGLADQVKQLQGELELYREQAASGEAGSQALKAELEQLEITAGLTDVEGPGVTIILEDSSQANVTGNEADYLIHDNDLLSVINELRSAGAEAISLNGERILATSEVRCTGAVVTVNGRRYAAPYVVFAIGDPDTLYSALTMRNGVVDVLSQWGITVKVTASDQLLIPKYNGTVEYQYAKPIPADEGGEEAVG